MLPSSQLSWSWFQWWSCSWDEWYVDDDEEEMLSYDPTLNDPSALWICEHHDEDDDEDYTYEDDDSDENIIILLHLTWWWCSSELPM
jgi:hypothetical protein